MRWMTEVKMHWLLVQRHLAAEGLPDRQTLDNAVKELRLVWAEWTERYPKDPWSLHGLIDATLVLSEKL